MLIACEFSGRVREAFRKLGHDAWSCDLLPTEQPGPHIRGPVECVLGEAWDMMLAFPPCTYLARSGGRWWAQRQAEQWQALWFVITLMQAAVPRIAVENPVGCISTFVRKPDQIIQPWQFGDGFTKTTCLWLKNLPRLTPTRVVVGRVPQVFLEPKGPNRSKNRSRTYPGIAEAMANQWGKIWN